jgi:hypothetical protein
MPKVQGRRERKGFAMNKKFPVGYTIFFFVVWVVWVIAALVAKLGNL